MRTDDPDVIFVRFKTWVKLINPGVGWEGFVDANDTDSIATACFGIKMNCATRHMHVAERAEKEIRDWLWDRQYG